MKNILVIIFIVALVSCKNDKKQEEFIENEPEEIAQSQTISSKILEPVKWSTETKTISETEYELIINASIEKDYHLYSQEVPDGGPLPTIFIFETSNDYELIGSTTEEKGHTLYDSIFKLNIKYFETKATFKQRVKVKNKSNFKIIGEIEFMTCNDANYVPGYGDFEFEI